MRYAAGRLSDEPDAVGRVESLLALPFFGLGFLSSFAGAVDCRALESALPAEAFAKAGAATNDPTSKAAADKARKFSDLLQNAGANKIHLSF